MHSNRLTRRCGHECCKVGKRSKSRSIASNTMQGKAGSYEPGSEASTRTASEMISLGEQFNIPKRLNRTTKRPLKHLEHDISNTESLRHVENETDDEEPLIRTKKFRTLQDRARVSWADSNYALFSASPAEDVNLHVPCNVDASTSHSASGSNSLSITNSAYSFEDPELSLMEFEESETTVDQEKSISLIVKPKSADNPTICFSTNSNGTMNGREMTSFRKWLAECVEIVSD